MLVHPSSSLLSRETCAQIYDSDSLSLWERAGVRVRRAVPMRWRLLPSAQKALTLTLSRGERGPESHCAQVSRGMVSREHG